MAPQHRTSAFPWTPWLPPWSNNHQCRLYDVLLQPLSWTPVRILWALPEVTLASTVGGCSILWDYSLRWLLGSILPRAVREGSNVPTSQANTLQYPAFPSLPIWWVESCISLGWICISLMTNELKHLFILRQPRGFLPPGVACHILCPSYYWILWSLLTYKYPSRTLNWF